MKRLLGLLFLVTAVSFVLRKPAVAVCTFQSGRPQVVNTTFTIHDENNATITFNGRSFQIKSPQCTTIPTMYKERGQSHARDGTVFCDEQTETNSVDSVRQPWCGSALERGVANSTCWQCGSGVIKCDGFDQAAGASSGFFDRSVPFGDNGQMWEVINPQGKISDKKFQYNGTFYDYRGERLLYCGPNNTACGASEQCFNLAHPKITNRGSGSDEPQCQPIARTVSAENDSDIRMSKRSWVDSPYLSLDKDAHLLTDIQGDNDRARGPQLSTIFGTVNTSPVITGLYQVNNNNGTAPISIDIQGGGNFGATLIELAAGANSAIYSPVIGYDIGGGFSYTVLYASPTELTLKATLEDSAAYGYTLHLADFQVDPALLKAYQDNEKNRSSQLVAIPCNFKIGTPLNGKIKTAIADTGTFMDPRVQKDWWNQPSASCAKIGIGYVTPLLTQECTVNAPPQETGVGVTAGAVKFDPGCTDKSGNFLCVAQRAVIELVGSVFPAKNQLKLPDLSYYTSVMSRAYPYFSPDQIQKNEIPIKQNYTLTATGNIGVETDEPKDTCFQEKEGVVTAVVPFLNIFTENAIKHNAFGGPYGAQPDFRLGPRFPNQKLNDRATRGCPDQSPGLDVDKLVAQSSQEQIYSGIPDAAKPVLLAAIRIKQTLEHLAGGGKCKEGDPNCSTGGGYQAKVFVHTRTPYGDTKIPESIGVDRGGASKGFARVFLPDSARKTYAAAIVESDFDHPGLFNPVPAPVPVPLSGIGGAIENLDDLLCAVTPLSKQTPEMNCNEIITNTVTRGLTSDWSTKSIGPQEPFSPSGDFATLLYAASQKHNVPLCVLQGVAAIEGGSRYKEMPKDACMQTVNSCSAAGPMQFTVGPGHGKATAEVCATKCAAGYCPNAWADWGAGGNPCRYEDAINAAAKMLAAYGKFDSQPAKNQRQAVHNATTAFYGSDNDEIARKTLKGCEYWEYVYRQCNPEYKCKATL